MHESHTPSTMNCGLPMCLTARSTYFSTALKSWVVFPAASFTHTTSDRSLPYWLSAVRGR